MRCCSSSLQYLYKVRALQSWSVFCDEFPSERQWQSTVSVPAPVGYAYVSSLFSLTFYHNRNDSSHPTEPQCSYDPVEGLTLAPDTDPVEKIKDLENQICESTDIRFNCFAIHECSSTTQEHAL